MSFKKDEMLIMPAVDIKNGKCVQLVQGEPGSEMVEIENPEKVAKHKAQFISIFLMAFLGVFVFAGVGGESVGLEVNVNDFYIHTI